MTKLGKEVLRLYKQIMLISRTWESVNASQAKVEQNYIKTEARKLFKKNKNVGFINVKPNDNAISISYLG